MSQLNLKPVTVKFKGQVINGFINLDQKPYACPYTETAPARWLLDAEGKQIVGNFRWGNGSKIYQHTLKVEENGTVITKRWEQGRKKGTGKPEYKHLISLY